MILGIGTGAAGGHRGRPLPHDQPRDVQIVPLPHGRAVEKQAGTTDLEKLGGLARKHARHLRLLPRGGRLDLRRAALQRVLLQGARLRRGPGARLDLLRGGPAGLVLTAASFLKLGHAAYFGKPTEQTRTSKRRRGRCSCRCSCWRRCACSSALPTSCPLARCVAARCRRKSRPAAQAFRLPRQWPAGGDDAPCPRACRSEPHFRRAQDRPGPRARLDHIHHAPVLASIYR